MTDGVVAAFALCSFFDVCSCTCSVAMLRCKKNKKNYFQNVNKVEKMHFFLMYNIDGRSK